MKHLMTLLALVVAVTAGAQDWNPDSDADGIIGVEDLMGLLSVFGMEWEDGPALMHIDSIQESDISFDWYVYQYPSCNLIDGCNGLYTLQMRLLK